MQPMQTVSNQAPFPALPPPRSEAANMRHCPELLWFVFWVLNHSYVMTDLWQRETPENFPNIRDARVELRNRHQEVIREVQSHLGVYPTRIRPEDCGRLPPILQRLKAAGVSGAVAECAA